jgi:16S rRNA (cytidine1402-2'-O)-methyltransferase
LVVSGLPAGRFVFEGFLPRRGSARAQRLASLSSEARTCVLYEAPHRLAATLADLVEVCGSDRPVALVRELTKLHEEVWRGSLSDAVDHVAAHAPRGEYVVVLGGAAPRDEVDDETIASALDRERAGGSSTRDAVALVSELLGVPKRRVYDVATRS